MNKILTPEKRIELIAMHRKERDARVSDRVKAVLLWDCGWTTSRIAEALLISETTVRDHVKIFEEEQRLDCQYKGSVPILDEKESELLSEHLETKIYTKIKEIQVYIKETLHKDIAISTLYNWLKANDFSYKKPKLVPKNVDHAKQEEFIKAYEKLMNEAAIEGDPVLFGDSVHPSQQTRTSYGWIKRGKDKVIETTAARKRLNIMAALNLETMRFAYQDFETINSEATITFLKEVELMYADAGTIHLILDQAGYHTSQEVRDFLKTSRIKVHYLPPRSPNLNSIERLWKIMHEYVSNNKVYHKFKDFKEALFNFFDKIMPSIKDILVSRITDNFQTLPRN